VLKDALYQSAVVGIPQAFIDADPTFNEHPTIDDDGFEIVDDC
jgi:hypothetical protein